MISITEANVEQAAPGWVGPRLAAIESGLRDTLGSVWRMSI